jgi:hypothetical protein
LAAFVVATPVANATTLVPPEASVSADPAPQLDAGLLDGDLLGGLVIGVSVDLLVD